ncbi:tetratricopeptide repeat protein [Desulfobacula sp.]|uniref:tetratricopeptide repeat protein n=1 Tax=Desulfobacula sp. TaxID=2593537 RepID=UPI0025C283D8|nr:tetratricopeptide repeat protein [Desulfobacula sp.]MBC2705450.1 tetratricopeptide repeat protein [Desulfobacula sp.]
MIIKNQISKGLMGCLFVFFCLFIFSGCATMKNWFSFLTDSDTVKTAEQLDGKELKDFMADVKPTKGNADSQYRLARHFQKQNRHEIAVEEFLKALKIDPTFYNAYNALGVSYDNLKQHDSAIDAYRAALKINPNLDYVYNNIGYSHLLKGDLEAAATAFETAVAMNAHHKIYQNNLALVQAKSGENISLAAVSHKVEKQALNPTAGKDQITRKMLTKIIDRVIGKKKIEDNYYAVQLGVYYDMNKAVQTLEKAQKRGYDSPYMTKIEKDKPYYRVRFGKYQTRAEAEVLASTILDKGGRPALTIVETYPVDVFQSEPVQSIALHKSVNIEVLNGNGIYRMARRVGNYFKQKGLRVVTPSNARHFNYQATRIYYAPGYYEDALELSRKIPGFEIAGKFIESKKLKTNIRVLIGKDIVPFDKELRKI